MDKAQKQLVDTYFRKRKLANDNGMEMARGYADVTDYADEFGLYHKYEMKYLVDANRLDLNHEHIDMVRPFIMTYPEYADKLDYDSFASFNSEEAAELIVLRPELITKFNLKRLFRREIDGPVWKSEVSYILENHPELIKYFPVHEFQPALVRDLVKHTPELKHYFGEM